MGQTASNFGYRLQSFSFLNHQFGWARTAVSTFEYGPESHAKRPVHHGWLEGGQPKHPALHWSRWRAIDLGVGSLERFGNFVLTGQFLNFDSPNFKSATPMIKHHQPRTIWEPNFFIADR